MIWWWFYFVCLLILIMVVVGGVIWLIELGFLIIEWKLIYGVILLMSEVEW